MTVSHCQDACAERWGPLTVSSTGNKAKRQSQSVGVASLRWCFCCQLAVGVPSELDRSDAVVKTKEGLLTRWQGLWEELWAQCQRPGVPVLRFQGSPLSWPQTQWPLLDPDLSAPGQAWGLTPGPVLPAGPTSTLAWRPGRKCYCGNRLPSNERWGRRSVTTSAKGRRAPCVEVWAEAPCTAWRSCSPAPGS